MNIPSISKIIELQPSHAEKAAKPEIKKFMMELSRTRKEAKSKRVFLFMFTFLKLLYSSA